MFKIIISAAISALQSRQRPVLKNIALGHQLEVLRRNATLTTMRDILVPGKSTTRLLVASLHTADQAAQNFQRAADLMGKPGAPGGS